MAKALRVIAAVVITFVGVAIIAAIGTRVSSNDYIEYWSSGSLFLHRLNPYSAPLILALEKAHGFAPNAPLIMLNPPWALFLVAPLGLLPYLPGLFLWIVMCAGCIVLSLLLLDVPPNYRGVAFLFAPVIASFSMQQSSPFMLLGLSLFLRFYRSRPFLAGASLMLLAIKPHLFLVFWAVLLGDCIYRRSFWILAGLASALACSSALAVLVVPHVWQDYLALIRGSALDQDYFPTLPTMFRVWIDVRLAWLALVPACIAILWGVSNYWINRSRWSWRREGMLIMLVTVLSSPYGWASDQIVLLPAVILAVVSSEAGSRRKWSMESLVVLNCAALAAVSMRLTISIWLPAAWFLWYLYAVRSGGDAADNGEEAPLKTADAPFSAEKATDRLG